MAPPARQLLARPCASSHSRLPRVRSGLWVVVSSISSPGWSALRSIGYLMRDGGEDAKATETCSSSASSRSPQACNFFEGFILGMHSAITSPPLDSHGFALFPTDVWICLGSKLLVIPMTKRDMDIFLIRHRRMAQRDLARRRSVPQPPTRLLVRSSQVLQASSTRVHRSSPYFSIPMLIIFSGSSFFPKFLFVWSSD